METKEFDNLSKEELFQVIKEKCKSVLKRDLYGGIIVLVLVILLLVFTWQRLDASKDISFFMFWIVFVCYWGWLLLNDYRFLKKVDSVDTPERLLYSFEKKHHYNSIGWIVACIFSLLHLLYYM